MNQYYARITKSTGRTDLLVGAIVPIELFHHRDGIGLDPSPLVEITVLTPAGERADVSVGDYVYATAPEAKRWRADQKRLRSIAKRGL